MSAASYRQIALAILEAGEEDGDYARRLSDALLGVEEPRSLVETITGMAAAVAFRAELTPRTVFEQMFAMCPSDDLWAGIVDSWREQREEGS